jgi:hypothetical protein
MNFAAKPTWRTTTIMLLMIGVAGSAVALWQRHSLLERRALAVSLIEVRQLAMPREQSSRLPAIHPQTLKEAADEADRLISSLQRPWEPMLNALQAALRDDVIIQRVQPETDAFRLRLSGQADSSQAFIEFVQRLQGDASWRAVEPLSEARPEAGQSNNIAPGGKPLVFQLTVEWRQP